MTKLLFKLDGAPDDEVIELRQLLADNAIDIYETEAGRWGTSVAAIWLRDEGQLEQARILIDDYQKERSIRIRAEYEVQRQAGNHETLSSRFMAHPFKIALYIIAIAALIALSLMPFFGIL